MPIAPRARSFSGRRGSAGTILCLLLVLPILAQGPLQFFLFKEVTATATIALVSYAMAVGIVVLNPSGRKLRQPAGPVAIAFWVYALYFLGNVIVLGDGFGLNHDWRRWITEVIAAPLTYLVARHVVKLDGSGYRLRRWLIWLAVGEAAVSLVALWSSGALSTLMLRGTSGLELTRDYLSWAQEKPSGILALAAGSFEHPNTLGGLLVVLVPQLFADTIHGRRQWWSGASRLMIVLVAILTTLSRGAWLALAAGAVVYLFVGARTLKATLMIAVVTLFLAVIPTSAVLAGRLGDQVTIAGRVDLLEDGFRLSQARPWTGYGLAFFASESDDRRVLENPHDDYLVRLLGGGWLGLAVFLGPFLAVFARCARVLASPGADRRSRSEAALTLSGFVAFMVAMTFNPIQALFPVLPITVAILDPQLSEAIRTRGRKANGHSRRFRPDSRVIAKASLVPSVA